MRGFEATFGRAPEFRAEATGRVNLIGEHTDYNDGYVLPTAIPQKTRVALALRDDSLVRLYGANVPAKWREFRLGEERPTGEWGDYAQGATKILREAGVKLRGFDAYVESDVPIGSGLSSSAALSVSLFRALEAAFRFPDHPIALAQRCQRVENEFVGARVGIMDPLAVALATTGTALFIDTRSLVYERIDLPMDWMDLLVVSSGVVHRNAASGGYNQRRAECESACARLGIRALRDVEPEDLVRVRDLPEPMGRRVRHVVTENARVLAAVAALRAKDLPRMGELLNASHASLRDDYEVSVPEIDFLVARAQSDERVFGARITGGGFGGSIVALTKRGAAAEVGKQLCSSYEKAFPLRATVLVG